MPRGEDDYFMGEVLTISREFGMIKAGELLAIPETISERSARQIPVSAEQLLRNISGVLENLVLSVIERRSGAEFEAARSAVFPQYLDAVLALSSLIQILVPQQAIERLNSEGFCELESAFRDRGLTAFGSAVQDQAMFTVWTLRKISDYMSQIVSAAQNPSKLDPMSLPRAGDLVNRCVHYAIRTRFHIHCLMLSMGTERPIHPEAMALVIDGLRSVVNACGLGRQLLDILVPLPEHVVETPEWDDEDQALLDEYAYDLAGEID
jgi:hypothetical protein